MAIKAWNGTIESWLGRSLNSGGNSSFKIGGVNSGSFGVGSIPTSSFKTGAKLKTNKATGGVISQPCGAGQVMVGGKCVGVNTKKFTLTTKKASGSIITKSNQGIVRCPTGYSLVNGVCRKGSSIKVTTKTVVNSNAGKKSSSGSKKSSNSSGKYVYSSGTGTRITGTAKEVSKYGGQKGTFAKK